LVYASVHYRLTAEVDSLTLQGSADLQGYGNALANTLYGNAEDNLLNGLAGADAVFENANEGSTRSFRPSITGCRRRWKPWCCRAAPTCRALLKSRFLSNQTYKLLGHALARDRPQPRASSAAHDHRNNLRAIIGLCPKAVLQAARAQNINRGQCGHLLDWARAPAVCERLFILVVLNVRLRVPVAYTPQARETQPRRHSAMVPSRLIPSR